MSWRCAFGLPGLIEVWIILLEQLTAAVSNCPRQHQPPTLDLLFELLRDVTKIPGKQIYVCCCGYSPRKVLLWAIYLFSLKVSHATDARRILPKGMSILMQKNYFMLKNLKLYENAYYKNQGFQIFVH